MLELFHRLVTDRIEGALLEANQERYQSELLQSPVDYQTEPVTPRNVLPRETEPTTNSLVPRSLTPDVYHQIIPDLADEINTPSNLCRLMAQLAAYRKSNPSVKAKFCPVNGESELFEICFPIQGNGADEDLCVFSQVDDEGRVHDPQLQCDVLHFLFKIGVITAKEKTNFIRKHVSVSEKPTPMHQKSTKEDELGPESEIGEIKVFSEFDFLPEEIEDLPLSSETHKIFTQYDATRNIFLYMLPFELNADTVGDVEAACTAALSLLTRNEDGSGDILDLYPEFDGIEPDSTFGKKMVSGFEGNGYRTHMPYLSVSEKGMIGLCLPYPADQVRALYRAEDGQRKFKAGIESVLSSTLLELCQSLA